MNTNQDNHFPAVMEGTIGEGTVPTVSARDLHVFLEVTSKFADWIKNRIADFGFAENLDYVSFSKNLESGGKAKEYAVSLDMAKELSMVERNEKGKQARQYFIECERRAKDPVWALASPAQLRALLLDNVEKVLALESRVTELEPQAASYEHLTRTDGTMCLTDGAKALDMRPKDFFAWLQRLKWVYRRAGNGHWVGYQDKTQQGLLDHRVTEVTRSDGTSKITEQVRITAKGLAKLGSLMEPV